MKKLLIALSIFLPLACTSGGDLIDKCLTDDEYDFVSSITTDYSSYVFVQLGKKEFKNPREMYRAYFEQALPVAVAMGSADAFRPVDNGLTSEFSAFEDDVVARFYETDDKGLCRIKKDGKYMEILSTLARKGGFYKAFYKYMKESDGCDGVAAITAVNYKKFKFERPEDRFLFTFAILTSPEGGYTPFK